MEISWLLLAVLCAIALPLVSKIIIRRQSKRKLPPGPKPWPVIGNLNLLGSKPHQSLHYLSKKYGAIMQLKFGKFPIVVASSPEMAEQFLKVHDTTFASRPALAAGKYTSYNYSDVLWAPYGPYWREMRKIFVIEVFRAKKLELFEQSRAQEGRKFLARLRALSGKPVVLRDHLTRHSLSIISNMVIRDEDKEFNPYMDELPEMVDEWFHLNGVFNVGDWIPWLAPLDLQGYVKKMKALNKKMDKFYNYVIDDHLARKSKFEVKDLVDELLQMAADPDSEVKLTRDCVKALIQNLLVGGTDTSATSVEWAIQETLKQPRILKKARDELDRVIGRNRWVDESDSSQLPYIDAIIMESFRLHPLGVLLAPHCAIEDCNVAGYDIAKGTMILINVWSLGRDPHSWDAPQEFLPERFMDKEIDMFGSNFSLLPFGSGRRSCPGFNLGLKVVRTTLANLLHGFEFKLMDNMMPQDISTEELYGLSIRPEHTLSLIMEPTLPSHLY